MKAEKHMDQSNQKDRRDFVKTATKLSGILALLGISAESFGAIISAEATPTQDIDPSAKAIQLLFTEAIDSGDVRTAAEKHRRAAKLNDSQVGALMSITREELAALRSLRGKLTPLKLPQWVMATGDCEPAPPAPGGPGGGGGGGGGPIPPYGAAIRNAIARGELQEMKNTAANARNWLKEVNSALAQLDSSIKKIKR